MIDVDQVSRIAGAEVDKPYDVLGVNCKMSFDNIKKRLSHLLTIRYSFSTYKNAFTFSVTYCVCRF